LRLNGLVFEKLRTESFPAVISIFPIKYIACRPAGNKLFEKDAKNGNRKSSNAE